MRATEGQALDKDLRSRGQTILELVAQVEQGNAQTVRDYRARLEAKLQEVLENTAIDESRILTEAAIFADKVAVDEETVRLRSHLFLYTHLHFRLLQGIEIQTVSLYTPRKSSNTNHRHIPLSRIQKFLRLNRPLVCCTKRNTVPAPYFHFHHPRHSRFQNMCFQNTHIRILKLRFSIDLSMNRM